jgi:hypothetical protein
VSLLRQYLYFCTSKTSKVSSCVVLPPHSDSNGKGRPPFVTRFFVLLYQ